MKYYFSLILIFSSLYVGAQSKWSVGPIVGVDMTSLMKHRVSYFSSQGSRGSSNFDFRLQSRFGLNLEYRLNDKISFKSGIRMNNQGVRVVGGAESIDNQIITFDINGGVIIVDRNMPVEFDRAIYMNRVNFFEVPLHIKLLKAIPNGIFFIETGFSPNIYLRSDSSVKYNNEEVELVPLYQLSSFNRFNLSLDFGVGMQRNIGERLGLFVQPMARVYLRKAFHKLKDLGRFYNLGVETGLTYYLK